MALAWSQVQLRIRTHWLLPRGSVKKHRPPQNTVRGSVAGIAGKELVGILEVDMIISSEREIILAISSSNRPNPVSFEGSNRNFADFKGHQIKP